jgi:class 3 adenylate cyclase
VGDSTGGGPTRYAKRHDGAEIAYRTAGEGPIDLVFSVGLTNVETLWDHPASARFFDRFASFSRLIVFDFRGSGVSDGLESPGFPTWEDWTDDLLAVLDDLGSEQAVLAMQAMAIPSGLIFAATYPDRTSALVLFGPSAEPMFEAGIGPTTQILEQGWGADWFAGLIAPSMAHDPTYLAWAAKTQRIAATPRLASALVRNNLTFDPRPFLPLIQVPTLVFPTGGTLEPNHARDFVSRIPNATFIDLKGPDQLLFGTATSDEVQDHVERFLTGAATPGKSDRVLSTVLFTDIVASTERATEMGDTAWRRLLDAHDETVRRCVATARGRVVKTTGDGALATIDGPARGVNCAKEIRSALESLGIEIRAGLHTGEVELRENDIGGIAVHIGARVLSQAEPAEILVSSTVKDLVVGSDLRFEDRGVHALKGVADEWRLFSVT